MKDDNIHIIGAGPAGLAAAINLAKAGYHAIVHEKHDNVDHRFNNDFQVLENLSLKEDVIFFLKKSESKSTFSLCLTRATISMARI